MNNHTEYAQLPEQKQKEFIFQVDSRLRYIHSFYNELIELVNKYESPFTEKGVFQIKKSTNVD